MTTLLQNRLSTSVDSKLESRVMLAGENTDADHLFFTDNPVFASSPDNYPGEVFLDVKQLIQNSTASSEEVLESAKEFINRFDDEVQGIRVPIYFPGQAGSFDAGYLRYSVVQEVIEYANEKGLRVYASPAGAGDKLPALYKADPTAYAARISAFLAANDGDIHYVSPFNEPGLSTQFLQTVMNKLESGRAETVGPDFQHLSTTLNATRSEAGRDLLDEFDIISSHNLEIPESTGTAGTSDDWLELIEYATDGTRQEVWESEARQAGTNANRVDIATSAEVDNVVLYESTTDPTDYFSVRER